MGKVEVAEHYGGFNHALYYRFSPFYQPGAVTILSLLPYALLAIAAATARKTLATRRLAIPLLIVMLVIFQIMLGNNNIIYRFLYQHILAFQVFRNVTKLAPLLELLLTFAIYAFLYEGIQQSRRFWAAGILLVASLLYNTPYWTFSSYMYGSRAVQQIPHYWREAATFINDHTNGYDRILALPAIYVNDIYFWNSRKTWVQGSLLDILIKDQSFRLSERSIGSPQYQADADSVFVKSNRSVRRLDVDYNRLTWLAKKYDLDYVVLSKDLLSEYEQTSDIIAWLKRSGYHKLASFGPVSIYRNTAFYSPPFTGVRLVVRRINNLRYLINVRASSGSRTLRFNAPFHSGWQLVSVPQIHSLCPSSTLSIAPKETICGGGLGGSMFDEIMNLFNRDSAATHYITKNGTNGWRFTRPLTLGETFELYFRPQGLFYVAVLLSVFSFAVVFGFLLLTSRLSFPPSLRAGEMVKLLVMVWMSLAILATAGRLLTASPRDGDGTHAVSYRRSWSTSVAPLPVYTGERLTVVLDQGDSSRTVAEVARPA